MSIAAAFRAKYDVALTSADQTRGSDPDCRRASLMLALDRAGYVLVEKDYVQSLFDTIAGPLATS